MTPPINITLSKNKQLLTVSFENNDFALSSEYLRVYSPSAEVRGHGPGQETLQLNIRTLSDLIGSARLSFAKPERVKSKLGVEPGAISPFALINNPQNDINMIFDATLMAAKVVNFHPLVNDRTTAITPDDLVLFLQACGHSPVYIDLNPGTDQIK